MVKALKACRTPKKVENLRQLVESSAELFGDKALYIYKVDKQERVFTHRDNLAHMNRLGTAFSEIGLMGKRVAVIGDTTPAYMTTYYAAVNGGGVIVPLDKEINDEELINFMLLSEVSAVVYTAQFNGRLIKFADRLPAVEFFIPIFPDVEELSFGRVRAYDELIELGQRALEAGNRKFLDHKIDMEKMCTILFTSGTTGTSKGVMLNQRNLSFSTNASCMSMEYDESNSFVSVLPMHHSYEVTCGHLAITNLGPTIYINDSLKNVMRSFASFKPNALMLVPLFVETIYKRIWAEIDRKGMRGKVWLAMRLSDALLACGVDMRDKFFGEITGQFGGNLKSIVCGGAPISPQLIKDFYSFGIFVLEGYGITECSPLVAVNSPGKVRFHSVGQPVYGCKVKIDRQEGSDTGEILVKGENVMMGYYKNEEATKAAFTEDGWFRTGDIGYMDKDDYIFITGRKKNVIILSNGKNIFPEELEEHLSHCELVKECLVVGRKNENGDVVITAVIYPDKERLPGKTAEETYEAVKSAVNSLNKNLPTFKHIANIEIRDTEFEKTTSKKIKRYIYNKY